MFARGSRAAHKQWGQVFSNAAVLNSSWFNKLTLLFSEWQSGYLSIIILRGSPSQMLDSAFDSTGIVDLAGVKERNRSELLLQGMWREKGSPITEGAPVSGCSASAFVLRMFPSQRNICLSSEGFALMCPLSITSAIYVAAVTSTEVGWEGMLQRNADWFAGRIYRAKINPLFLLLLK